MTSDEVYILGSGLTRSNEICEVLLEAGLAAVFFADVPALISTARDRQPVCLLVNLTVADKVDFKVLRILQEIGCAAPIIAMSSRASIRSAVKAIKCGAFDFVDSSIDRRQLVGKIKSAIETRAPQQVVPRTSFRQLTMREKQVLDLIVSGSTNKEIAKTMEISHRTVEYHRMNIMRKCGARSSTQLLILATDTVTVAEERVASA